MKEIKTLEDALALVPEYWPLVPRADKWKEGDEYFAHSLPFSDSEENWLRAGKYHIDSIQVVMPDALGRRPIPQSVREVEARWILYSEMTRRFRKPHMQMEYRGTVHTPSKLGYVVHGNAAFDYPWISHEQRELIGGESAVIQILTEGPGALWRWVAENRK